MSERRSLAEWLSHQQLLHPNPIDLGLDRVSEVARRLQLLPLAGSSIIVGGTNGKGSTAHHVAALLRAAGMQVGLFTSPHLRHYSERIVVDGVECSELQLVTAFEQIEAARGALTLTFFEYSTLAALLVFREQGVTATVLEVGLGGRLDATNIVAADLAILCSIGLDHTEWLGSTLEEIGREKAGIFRAGQAVVLGCRDMPGSVYRAIATLGCALQVAGHDFEWQSGAQGRWTYRDADGELRDLPQPLLAGAIQYRNAATAIAAVRALAKLRAGVPAINAVTAALGLAQVRLQGRLQVVPGEVEWLLDVGHNPPAAAVLAAALSARGPARRTLAVFGMLADKDAGGVASRLDPLVDEWLLCSTDDARGLSARELRARLGPLRGAVHECTNVGDACQLATQLARPGDRVLVFGSFHVVGPALDWLEL